MNIRIDINSDYGDMYVTVHAKEWTEELEHLIKTLEQQSPKRILGIKSEQSILLSPEDMDYIFAQHRKVYASVNKQAIEINMKLYELEELLESRGFIRLSKSALGNLHRMTHFELGFNGNMCVYFRSGSKEYVSRRYVQALKKKLILGGD